MLSTLVTQLISALGSFVSGLGPFLAACSRLLPSALPDRSGSGRAEGPPARAGASAGLMPVPPEGEPRCW